MRAFLNKIKVSYLLTSLLYIALGLLIILRPSLTGTILCFIFGGILLLYGAVTIISFLVHEGRSGSYRFELVIGVVTAALGILFLVNPTFVLSIFPVILGIYIIVDAFLNLGRAAELHRMDYGRWWIVLLLSLVSMALGVLVFVRPLFLADFIIQIIGGVLIYSGVTDLWSLFMVGRVGKAFRKNHPIEIDPIDVE